MTGFSTEAGGFRLTVFEAAVSTTFDGLDGVLRA
jgi:hypothetical protein